MKKMKRKERPLQLCRKASKRRSSMLPMMMTRRRMMMIMMRRRRGKMDVQPYASTSKPSPPMRARS